MQLMSLFDQTVRLKNFSYKTILILNFKRITQEMVKHNNIVPNGHFKKNWQKYIKTWFNQPAKKKNRKIKRMKKNRNNIKKNLTLDVFRPVVHCPTLMHNLKIKLGRGFSVKEIAKFGLSKGNALSIGISIDPRKRNVKYGKQINTLRLKSLFKNIEIFKEKKNKKVDKNMNKKTISDFFKEIPCGKLADNSSDDWNYFINKKKIDKNMCNYFKFKGF